MVIIKRRYIPQSDQLASRNGLFDGQFAFDLFPERLHQIGRDDQGIFGLWICAVSVLDPLVNGSELVRREGPWGGRPYDQRSIGLIDQREANIDARIGHLTVPLSDLSAAQGRTSLGPPPNDLVSSVEQASVEEILEGPPNAFDIALMVGNVSFREIDPKA